MVGRYKNLYDGSILEVYWDIVVDIEKGKKIRSKELFGKFIQSETKYLLDPFILKDNWNKFQTFEKII